MDVNNWNQLEPLIKQILIDVLNEVGEMVVETMQKHIHKDIYQYGNGKRRYYKPTYEFFKSVVRDPAKVVRDEVRVTVYHDPNKMEPDEENFIHGSLYWTPNDIRKYLPEILAFNASGKLFNDRDFYHVRDNYWYDTLDELQKNGQLRIWLMQALRKRGLTVK